jgi:hypothetical protein
VVVAVGAIFWMCRQGLERRRAPVLLSCSPGSPVVPLLTFAQSSGPARELPRHSGGFHVRSGRAPPIIWHSRAGSTQRLSTKKWGWTTKNWPSDRRPGRSRKGLRRGLSGHGRTYRRRPRGSGIPSPRRPIWLLLAAITWLRKRHAAGLRPWSARRLSRVADGGTTSMLRRDGVRYLTPWTPSGACGNVCGRATASGIGGDRKGGDEDDRDDCQHCNLALPNSRKSLPERQRTAFAIMIERLGCDHAIDVYNAGGLADLVAAHGNRALEQRQAAGQDTMVLSARRSAIFRPRGSPAERWRGRHR